jgi:hypothetical protein
VSLHPPGLDALEIHKNSWTGANQVAVPL